MTLPLEKLHLEHPALGPVEWRVTDGLTPYEVALEHMKARAEAVARDEAPEEL